MRTSVRTAFSITPQEVCGHTVGVAFAKGESVEQAESAELLNFECEEKIPQSSLRLTAPFRQGSLSYLKSNATSPLGKGALVSYKAMRLLHCKKYADAPIRTFDSVKSVEAF